MGGSWRRFPSDYLTRMVNIAGGNVRYSVAMPRKRIKRAVRRANEKSTNA